MKRIAAFALTVMMVFSVLAGCGKNTAETNNETSKQPVQTEAEKTKETNQAEPAAAAETETASMNNSDEPPYEIILENLTLGAEYADLAEVEEAVSALTLPAINCTFKFLNIHIADHVTKLSLMAAGGEKVDIVTTGRTYKYPNMVADGLLLPLDDLLAERGQTVVEKAGFRLDAERIAGSIYAVPQEVYTYSYGAFKYNKDMADKYGITVKDELTVEDLEALAAEVKAADPEMYFITRGIGDTDALINMYIPEMLPLDGQIGFGVIDRNDPDMKVYDLYESDAFRAYCHKNHEWYANEWVPQDSMVSGVNVRDVFKTQKCFAESGGGNPMEMGMLQATYEFKIEDTKVSEPQVTTAGIQENGWGIFINCERPDKAMDFLNMLYDNPELANLLNYGIEGKHYVKVSERVISYPEGVTPNDVGYAKVFSKFGDMMKTYQWHPVKEEDFDVCMAINNEVEPTATLGYTFDTSSLTTQVSNVTNVLAEYLPPLVVDIYNDAVLDAELDKMIAALKAAGIDDIIAENQRQLDAWRAGK